MTKLTALLIGILLTLVLAASVSAKAYAIPGLQIQPQSVGFGRQVVGACNTETLAGCKLKTVTLTNTGSMSISISGIEFSTAPRPFDDIAYGLDRQTCIGTLAPGASCIIRFTATPTITGKVKGEVRISRSDQFDVIGRIPVRSTGI